MKIKSRVQVVLYEENSDAEQRIVMVINGEHPSEQDFQKVMSYYPDAWVS